ncbi:Protein CBG03514 [Caenorhabditis briggsae]|uniref:Protein CBG03514 n=1 Tax=Caenorhabditis briggsae TaxID=6238 RepID=A8WV85_CAEBR|nr:Protein CBG03514 [Caenorhabditis briggsae]CAP24396.2 Protein CBG03514 [Caenorhabditis briggsae]
MKFIFCILFVLRCASAQFSATAKEAILKTHNDLRSAIARGNYSANEVLRLPASNMRKMKWDSCLEESARNLAITCPDDHYEGAEYGENVFVIYTGTPGLIRYWALEHWISQLNSQWYERTITKDTQMAWAEIDSIGCYLQKCEQWSSEPPLDKIVMVCKYELPDNLSSSRLYKPGTACSSCDPGFTCETDSGLCV